MNNKFEMGDNLEALVDFARDWFSSNNIEIPTASNWQYCKVTEGELPPGCSKWTLKSKWDITPKNFINLINHQPVSTKYQNVIMDYSALGFTLISKAGKSCTVLCMKCNIDQCIEYGTLDRMRKRGDKFCYMCRKAGGKEKPLNNYDISGFDIIQKIDSKLTYVCKQCSQSSTRTLSHINTAESLVCYTCNPRTVFGCKTMINDITFDSHLEAQVYTWLISQFSDLEIQVPYNRLFKTGTKHTADFYIPSLNLVLEVGNMDKTSNKYKDNIEWKLSLSSTIKFARNLKEVKDIVRSLLKDSESTAENCRDVGSCCLVRR